MAADTFTTFCENLTNTQNMESKEISDVVERILSDNENASDSGSEYDGSDLFDDELAIAAGDFRADSGRGSRSIKRSNERSKSTNARATNAQMYFDRWPQRAMKKAEKLIEEGKTRARKRAGHVVSAKPSSF
ncbi:hypothetical protein BJ742DRAFT_768386 [Cladochytrium replicatum]|nr:hypothetical protein BJ742DRAFT_768386 [Cladochytrium replicatum]